MTDILSSLYINIYTYIIIDRYICNEDRISVCLNKCKYNIKQYYI